MPQPDWDALAGEFRDLRSRVSRLEHQLGFTQPAAAPPDRSPSPPLHSPASLLPLPGRPPLGLAGPGGALLLATTAVLPCPFVVLAIAAAVAVSACLNHWLSERWLAATAAGLAVLLATWLVTNERGLPDGYAPIPHSALLAAQV